MPCDETRRFTLPNNRGEMEVFDFLGRFTALFHFTTSSWAGLWYVVILREAGFGSVGKMMLLTQFFLSPRASACVGCVTDSVLGSNGPEYSPLCGCYLPVYYDGFQTYTVTCRQRVHSTFRAPHRGHGRYTAEKEGLLIFLNKRHWDSQQCESYSLPLILSERSLRDT